MRLIDDPKVLAERIDAYFSYIKGEYHIEAPEPAASKKTTDALNKIIWDRLPEPALLTGLALFLGFASRHDFEQYGQTGRCKKLLKFACLRVEAEYEKRLHQQSPTGAIFALKSMGWAESQGRVSIPKTLRIEIVEAGPRIASSEKQVLLDEPSSR